MFDEVSISGLQSMCVRVLKELKYVARESIPLQFRAMVVTSGLHQPSFSNSLFTLSFLSQLDLNLDLNKQFLSTTFSFFS